MSRLSMFETFQQLLAYFGQLPFDIAQHTKVARVRAAVTSPEGRVGYQAHLSGRLPRRRLVGNASLEQREVIGVQSNGQWRVVL